LNLNKIRGEGIYFNLSVLAQRLKLELVKLNIVGITPGQVIVLVGIQEVVSVH